jgi:hypothetical protein
VRALRGIGRRGAGPARDRAEGWLGWAEKRRGGRPVLPPPGARRASARRSPHCLACPPPRAGGPAALRPAQVGPRPPQPGRGMVGGMGTKRGTRYRSPPACRGVACRWLSWDALPECLTACRGRYYCSNLQKYRRDTLRRYNPPPIPVIRWPRLYD